MLDIHPSIQSGANYISEMSETSVSVSGNYLMYYVVVEASISPKIMLAFVVVSITDWLNGCQLPLHDPSLKSGFFLF